MLGIYTAWVMENFRLVMFLLAVVMVLSHKLFLARRLPFVEIVYRWFILLPVGITALYAFAMNAFSPEFTAAMIGWQSSPFQFDAAMANLSVGVIAILSFHASYGFRLATVLGNTIWLWGRAITQAYLMAAHYTFSLTNAGSWFWIDVSIPLILLLCIAGLRNTSRR